MPVTAKLSRSFYDKLGDDVASELVDWFNAVDTDYKNDLRELNDRNWERFRAEMGAHGTGMHAEFAKVRTEMHAELAKVRTEMHAEFAKVRSEFQAALAAQRSELIKWMFIFWSGTVVPIVGLLITVIALIK